MAHRGRDDLRPSCPRERPKNGGPLLVDCSIGRLLRTGASIRPAELRPSRPQFHPGPLMAVTRTASDSWRRPAPFTCVNRHVPSTGRESSGRALHIGHAFEKKTKRPIALFRKVVLAFSKKKMSRASSDRH